MNKSNDLLQVKQYMIYTNNKFIKGILKRLLKKGGLDEVIQYVEIFELKFHGSLLSDDLFDRLQQIEKCIDKMKEIKDTYNAYYLSFTIFKNYEEQKQSFEREINERENSN